MLITRAYSALAADLRLHPMGLLEESQAGRYRADLRTDLEDFDGGGRPDLIWVEENPLITGFVRYRIALG